MDLSGQKLGKYDLLERLGQGGMAQVYKARQPMIERMVAIKVMQSHLADSPQFVERFMREAQRLGQLRHPNIVSVLDFDIVGGTHYLVMDYVGGPTLDQHQEAHRVLSPIEALRLASQIAGALQYAHEKGVVHCDLKPTNVLFQDENLEQVVLTDFGIARLVDPSGLAHTSSIIGTPSYISPEAAQGQPFDGRADIYSLGVMLYEMVTGELPYVADSPVSLLMQHVSSPIPNLSETHPSLPPEIGHIIQRAMGKSPDERYSSAAEMKNSIDAALGALDPSQANIQVTGAKWALTGARGLTAPGTVPEAALQRRRLALYIGGGILALVVMVCVVGVGFLVGVRGTPISSLPIFGSAPTATTEGSLTQTVQDLTPTTGAPIAVESPTPTPLPTSEPYRHGSLSLALDGDGNASLALLLLDHLVQPPPGSQYVLWLGDGDQFVNMGTLALEDGRARLFTSLESDLLQVLDQARITLEGDQDSLSSPSDEVMFFGELSEGRLAEFRQFTLASDEATFKPYLSAILDQANAALWHQNSQVEALSKGDLNEARMHAEHVINILEGEHGAHFGDLDGNGRAENPGDDVGVEVYLNQANQRVLSAASADPQTVGRHSQAEKVSGMYLRTIQILQGIVNLNLELLEASDLGQAQPPAQQAQAQFSAMLYGTSGVEGAWWANHFALQVLEIPLLASDSYPPVRTPEPDSIPPGVYRMAENGDFTFQVNGLPIAPPEMAYHLWAGQADGSQFLPLGQIPQGELSFSGNAPLNLQSIYSQILMSLERMSESTLSAPGRLVLSGEISSSAANFLNQLTEPPELGELSLAEVQAALAAEHIQFLSEALNNDDLLLAKRHSEHIVNILEGQSGEHYGDVNGDGNPQDPGDGVGVLGHLNRALELAMALQSEPLSPSQVKRLDQLLANAENTVTTINLCYEAATKVIASDSVEEAQNNAQPLEACVQAVMLGQDSDRNGVIDLLVSEGGLQAIRELAGLLGVVELQVVTP